MTKSAAEAETKEKLAERLLPTFLYYFRPFFTLKGIEAMCMDREEEKKDVLLPVINNCIETWLKILLRAGKNNRGELDIWTIDDNMLPICFNKKLFFCELGKSVYFCGEKILDCFSRFQKEMLSEEEGTLPREMVNLLELNDVKVSK